MIDLTALSDAELTGHMLAVSAEISRRSAARNAEARMAAAVRGAEQGGLAGAEIDAVIQKLSASRVRPPSEAPATTPVLPGQVAVPQRAKTL